jgi:hypothetical protein
MKKFITNLLILIGINTLVILAWQGLEMCIDGVIIATKVDNIIGTILVLSLYYNFRHWIEK